MSKSKAKVMPEGFTPPKKRSGRPPAPEIQAAQANPGRWMEIEASRVKSIRASLHHRNKAAGKKVWDVTLTGDQGYLIYNPKGVKG